MTRVALSGCGWIQEFHARGVRAHPRGELVAAANHRVVIEVVERSYASARWGSAP